MNHLLFKPDWEETKARFRAWWNHDYFGRCALAVCAPRDNPPALPPPPDPCSIREKWYDLEGINQRQQYRMAHTFYGGEALPIWDAGYPGNTSLPVLLGSRFALDWHTGWTEGEPLLATQLDVPSLKIDLNHPEFQFHLETSRKASVWAHGRCLVTLGAFGASGDTLAALRGNETLLMDCLDRPDWVRNAELYLMDMWCQHYDRLYAEIREADEGSTCWFPLWSPGKFYAAQCDFSYMISPDTFRDLFLPAIRRQSEFLDHTVYHVDGIGSFVHVPALCELPRIQTIQILPGAGKPSPLHYLEVLHQVQRAGKNLHITLPADEVQLALSRLSARGLFIQTWCDSESSARQLLNNTARWSADRG